MLNTQTLPNFISTRASFPHYVSSTFLSANVKVIQPQFSRAITNAHTRRISYKAITKVVKLIKKTRRKSTINFHVHREESGLERTGNFTSNYRRHVEAFRPYLGQGNVHTYVQFIETLKIIAREHCEFEQ